MASIGQSKDLHILSGTFSLDNAYLKEKSPLLVRDMLVTLGDILKGTSKSSASWDIGWNSGSKWLLLFSPDEVPCELNGTSLKP